MHQESWLVNLRHHPFDTPVFDEDCACLSLALALSRHTARLLAPIEEKEKPHLARRGVQRWDRSAQGVNPINRPTRPQAVE
jgi:hypothetical protein